MDDDHERLRDFKSYCFVGFVYISVVLLLDSQFSKFSASLSGVGRGLKKKKVNGKANNLIKSVDLFLSKQLQCSLISDQ